MVRRRGVFGGGVVEIPYSPREFQLEFHQKRKRWNMLICHRRFGKTVMAVNELIKEALSCPLERPRFHYVAPYHKQAKSVAWDYLKHYSSPIPGLEINEAELRVDYPNGGRIQLLGADNAAALRGIYSDGVVLDEYGNMNPRVWEEVIRAWLSDRKGWAAFLGTPQGDNHFSELYDKVRLDKGWFVRAWKASKTRILDQEELDSARQAMSEEQFMQEFECSFASGVQGAYYAKLIEKAEEAGRICRLPYRAGVPVYTSWDIGVSDSTAIWFWQDGGHGWRHYLDFYENSGEGLPHYAKVVKERGEENEWIYGTHFMPHDFKAREFGTGLSGVEAARAAKLGSIEILKRQEIPDRIEAVRMLIPRVRFDLKCLSGIKALKNYKKVWNEDRKVFADKPLHDWSSHAADAFGYGAVAPDQGRPVFNREKLFSRRVFAGEGGWMGA